MRAAASRSSGSIARSCTAPAASASSAAGRTAGSDIVDLLSRRGLSDQTAPEAHRGVRPRRPKRATTRRAHASRTAAGLGTSAPSTTRCLRRSSVSNWVTCGYGICRLLRTLLVKKLLARKLSVKLLTSQLCSPRARGNRRRRPDHRAVAPRAPRPRFQANGGHRPHHPALGTPPARARARLRPTRPRRRRLRRPRHPAPVGTSLPAHARRTQPLDRLESQGLIRREPDPRDRRGRLIALTDEGGALVDRAVEAHVQNEQRLLAGLPAARRRELSALLRELLT